MCGAASTRSVRRLPTYRWPAVPPSRVLGARGCRLRRGRVWGCPSLRCGWVRSGGSGSGADSRTHGVSLVAPRGETAASTPTRGGGGVRRDRRLRPIRGAVGRLRGTAGPLSPTWVATQSPMSPGASGAPADAVHGGHGTHAQGAWQPAIRTRGRQKRPRPPQRSPATVPEPRHAPPAHPRRGQAPPLPSVALVCARPEGARVGQPRYPESDALRRDGNAALRPSGVVRPGPRRRTAAAQLSGPERCPHRFRCGRAGPPERCRRPGVRRR